MASLFNYTAGNIKCIFDEHRIYRYVWSCEFGDPTKRLMFTGLNPSKADEYILDNTVNKLLYWTKLWGYGALDVANAFAYRSTDPKKLKEIIDPIGPENNYYIKLLAEKASLHLVGWGRHAILLNRGYKVGQMLIKYKPVCMGINSDGSPKHPLFIKYTTIPIPWL